MEKEEQITFERMGKQFKKKKKKVHKQRLSYSVEWHIFLLSSVSEDNVLSSSKAITSFLLLSACRVGVEAVEDQENLEWWTGMYM